MATKSKKPTITIQGWLFVFPDGKTILPNKLDFCRFWTTHAVKICVRENIEDAVEAMYGLPLRTNHHYISKLHQQPLYKELEKLIQNLQEWQELKSNAQIYDQKIRESEKLSEIDKYRIAIGKENRIKIAKHQLKRSRYFRG